jgi:hypothetical protein
MNLGTARVIRADSRHLPLADAAWLAGVIDSEGTVSLVSSHARNPILRISIYNSSDLILDKVARILTEADVKWSEHADRRHERTGYAINFSTSSAMQLYDALRPHMVRHASRYDAAYWFMHGRGVTPGGRRRWTDADRATWDNLRAVLNAPR